MISQWNLFYRTICNETEYEKFSSFLINVHPVKLFSHTFFSVKYIITAIITLKTSDDLLICNCQRHEHVDYWTVLFQIIEHCHLKGNIYSFNCIAIRCIKELQFTVDEKDKKKISYDTMTYFLSQWLIFETLEYFNYRNS